MTFTDRLSKIASGGYAWIKVILLLLVILTIGVVLFYVFGRSGAVISFFRKLVSGLRKDKGDAQKADMVSEDTHNSKIDTATMDTTNAVEGRLDSIDKVLDIIEGKK